MNPLDLSHSGEVRVADTGAQRDAAVGKGRFDLIPYEAIRRLAIRYEIGAARYGENNWRRGMPLHWFMDSAMRHLHAWNGGDRSEDHLGAALWNIAGYIETDRRIDCGELPIELKTL